jgi:hypothetical protein
MKQMKDRKINGKISHHGKKQSNKETQTPPTSVKSGIEILVTTHESS